MEIEARIRPAVWPDDIAAISRLETGFTTDRIYRLVRGELSAALQDETVDPPLSKRYPLDLEERDRWGYAAVVETRGLVVGFVSAEHQAWNRRMAVWHLYVAAAYRGQGVGKRLLGAVEEYAASAGARCLWVETQNVNYPAIRFYLGAGFRFCGFDESLYDAAGTDSEEVALFFARPVGG